MTKIFLPKEWFIEKYIKEGLSCPEIASILGNITRQGVFKAIRRLGIPIRSKKDAIFYENGERCKISQGYFWIYRPSHHRANNGYVKRSVLVLEEKLGRPLLPGELPHHGDNNRLNDTASNLEVSNRPEHMSLHMTKWYSRGLTPRQ